MKLTNVSSKFLLIALLALLGSNFGCKSKTAEDSPEEQAAKKAAPANAEEEKTEPEVADQLPADEVSTEPGDGDLVGRVSRQMIEEQRADWKKAAAEAAPHEATAKALAEVEPGAEITIYFGAWCADCQRELPRFFKAVDLAGDVPFTYELIGLDKFFRADEVSADPIDLPAIPTFVVERDGEEVGRVVEKSPDGIEKDLLALLRGEQKGELSATK